MGSTFASDLAESVKGRSFLKLRLETALRVHFASNHYPPIPGFLVPVAIEAIEKAQAGEWDALLDLPGGVTWRGKTQAPVNACVESWHLDAFLDLGLDPEED